MDQKHNNVVRWGILSCARVARQRWMPAIEQADRCQICAIASRSIDKARSWAREWGSARAYGSYKELLEDDEIDAVFIGLPNSMDREWVVKSLTAGKHVLCDKPLGVNADEAREMAEAAQQHNRLLMEGFAYRYHRQYDLIQKWLDEGRIGRLQEIRVGFSFVFDQPGDFRYDPKLGGGVLLDLGCYCMDVLRRMSRAEPISVRAESSNNDTGADWTVSGSLEFAGGLETIFECSFAYEGDRSMYLLGTEGKIRSTAPFVSHGDSKLTLEVDGKTMHEKIKSMNAYCGCIEDFNQRIRKGDILPTPADDSVANMGILDAVRESARLERAVNIA